MKSKVRHPHAVPVNNEGFQRLCAGHPWIFRGHLSEEFLKSALKPGLYPLGEHWFLYSTQSNIALRRIGPNERLWMGLAGGSERLPILDVSVFEEHFSHWLKQHLLKTYQKKQLLLDGEKCFRWIFSESDLLPGLIVDVFENELAAQIQSEAMEWAWPAVRKILLKSSEELGLKNPVIFEIRRTKARLKEGLSNIEIPDVQSDLKILEWNSFKWHMQAAKGQKTGAYFDQRENHLSAANWAKKLQLKNAWDLCCYHGGFALHLAKAGLSVHAVDDSKQALEIAEKNTELNSLTGMSFEKADVFEFLRRQYDQKSEVDMIVLDPPSVSASKKDLNSALRGLNELHLRAFHCLKKSGLLVTCTCSHAINETLLLNVIREAAHSARRHVQVFEKRGPSPDHAALPNLPESDYLHAFYLGVE